MAFFHRRFFSPLTLGHAFRGDAYEETGVYMRFNAHHNEAWVTSALSDEEVSRALALCFSLKRSFTSRKVAVVASSKISLPLRQALSHGFDLVFYLEEDRNIAGLEMGDFAKVYSLMALQAFKAFAYVCPSMLAIKNCDDIFAEKPVGFHHLKDSTDTSVFLFKPTIGDFEMLMRWLSKSKDKDINIGTQIKTWTREQLRNTGTICDGYSVVISTGIPFIGSEEDISMINLAGYLKDSKISQLEEAGLLGKLVANYWLNILKEDVEPVMCSKYLDTGLVQGQPYLSYLKEPIAIVGMSCRYPESNNLEEFWDLLFNGKDGTGNPPPFRWKREQCSRYHADARKTNAGFLKTPIDEFDGKFFGISPKEVVFMDPQHRLLYELVWEGLEDACINPHTLRGTSASVFMGSWLNDYKDILMQSGEDEFYRVYMGNSIGAMAARISFLLGVTGPSIATESGCSSAIVALHLACRALQNRETNLALACGVNLLLHPFDKEVMPMVVSPDGHCKTFSHDANGFGRAEGGGVIILKRLSDALKENDNIWGIIRGSAVSQEGVSKSMGTPTVFCESLAMTEALRDADVAPEEISYVETHGTGTVVGDPMEVEAIARAYHSKNRKDPLVIGSVKTNLGHTESCSGITGIMKVVLSMHHEVIPAHRNFASLNPAVDLNAVPAILPLENLEWKRKEGEPRRVAGVSSFGITGTDAHVILEEPAIPCGKVFVMDKNMDRPLHLIKLSGKTEEAMTTLLERYKDAIQSSTDSIANIAYSANVGRANFSFRAAIFGKTREDMCTQIEQRKILQGEVCPDKLGKICFLFTGQGSQYSGMAKQLYDTSPIFRIHFEYCDKILQNLYNISIMDVLWSSQPNKSGNEISRTIYSQTSIFCVEYALLKLWESWGVKPDFALGHSLGEFAAAVCAGILTIEDAIKLVATRSQLIEKLPCGKMLVIKAVRKEVDSAMQKFANGVKEKLLDFAAINSPHQTVVAGDSDLVLEFSKFCTNNRLKCIVLEASHAFHSKHMDPILEAYRFVAQTVKPSYEKKCDFISGMQGNLLSDEAVDADYWVQHTRDKVEFMKASQTAIKLGCRTFIEIGPQPFLSALTMTNTDVNLLCLPSLKKNESEWSTLLCSLGNLYVKGVDVNWAGFDQFYNRKKVRLPHYPFMRKKYWPDLMQSFGNTIHPLIGSAIQNPSSTKLFKGGVNLRLLEYIKDHVIGTTVVFPGAGFLEMAIAAGLATLEYTIESMSRPSRPIKIENLSVKAPLALEESKTCQLQTVVVFNNSTSNELDWNDMNIKIFQRIESDFESKWLEHASATFCPVVTTEVQNDANNSEEILINKMCNNKDEDDISLTYDRLSSVGLKFGPAFRSIESLWKNENGTLLTKVKVPVDGSGPSSQYILHPVVLDAMIQSIMLQNFDTKMKNKLYVPVKVGKFLWMASESLESKGLFIQVKTTSKDQGPTALLLDSCGRALAKMSEVEFIDTTVKTVEAVLEQQISTMPQMWDETWRPQIGPLQYAHDLMQCGKERFYTDELYNKIVEKYDRLNPDLQAIFHNLEKLVYYNMLKCLYQCGFKPQLNLEYEENDLRKQLNIHERFSKMFGYFLRVLEEESILVRSERLSWKLEKVPPSLVEIENELLLPVYNVDLIKAFRPTLLFIKIGENLYNILQEKQSALSILFPEEGTKSDSSSVAEFYHIYGKLFGITQMATTVSQASVSHCKRHACNEKTILRVCEVGAGTGSFTEFFIESLSQENVEFEYTYTDISAAFFPAASKKFEKHLKNITFKKLNIEEDPISQDFTPAYYDHIVASDVIHATKDLQTTLANIKLLLKPGGRFDMVEMTRVNRFITYLFGLLDGFWHFEDLHVRPNHCTLSTQGWTNILELSGFEVIEAFPSVNQHHSLFCTRRKVCKFNDLHEPIQFSSKLKTWLLFHDEENSVSNFIFSNIRRLANRNVLSIESGTTFQNMETQTGLKFTLRATNEKDYFELMDYIEKCDSISLEGIVYCWSLDFKSENQEEILRPLFHLAKAFLRLKKGSGIKFIVLLKGVALMENNDLSQFPLGSIWGFMKSFQNERTDLHCRCVDIGNNDDESGLLQIFYELWSRKREAQVGFQGVTRYIPKVMPLKPELSALRLPPGCDKFQLILPETKSIADLKFGPLDQFVLNENEIEIQVKCSALNFRDVFSVLKPSEAFRDVNAVGFDFAGVVKRVHSDVTKWKVGDEVFGVNVNGAALPSHVKLHENDVLPVPNDMTLMEACTLPAVVATSYHCLFDIAKIKSTDTVLIHTASGGVGLSAIEICKHVGATIIATAGSKRKQNYLRSVGIQHVFHSRNIEYGDQILEVTNGRGVDVVLNSLTSEGFKEATLKACAYGARFVEMSKLSVWTPEDVKKMRPDVQYAIADVSSMNSQEWHRLITKLQELADAKVVTPIPYVRFDGVHIREALQYMQKAKHIGKIVCVMPEIRNVDGQTEIHTPLLNSKSTYLITGGLGGIGFEVCKWMVRMGATYILLAGRSPPTPQVQEHIDRLNAEHDSKIQAVQLDVSSFQQCKELIEIKIKSFGYPRLRGVMHAAGTLHDGLLENQTWDTLSSTFKTKIYGTINLHNLTKNNSRLEHFVLFSSFAALLGSPGQSNHSAGNQFEDTIAHFRNSIGLPATSVNWGQWGEVGVATELDLPGIKPFSTLQGLNGLEYALKSHRTQTAILNVESFVLLSKLYPLVSSYLDERVWKTATSTTSGPMNLRPDEFWQKYEIMISIEDKIDLLKDKIRFILRNILKLDETDVIQDNDNLQDLGVDSLMFVEIKNALQNLLGEKVTVSVSALRDCNTVQLLSDALVSLIEGIGISDKTIPTMEQINELMKEDSILAEHIKASPDQYKPEVGAISNVLLTGVTGTLGPYVLRELCKCRQITQITCLIRSNKNSTLEERLQTVLKERDLISEINLSKVVYVNGNVSMPHLGIEDDIWRSLCDDIDAVFHCAASVQHLEYYRREATPSNMRSINVGGLNNILEFCCAGNKLKHLYNASSLLALATLDEDGNLSENWPKPDDYNGVTKYAYPITKFVGDVLISEAVTKRGIPGKNFRFPLIAGDSRTGRFVLDQNHFMLRYLFMMKNGIMASNPFPLPIFPVDICAKVSVDIFFNPVAPDEVYNIVNSNPQPDQMFVSIAKRFGHDIKIVDFAEFSKKVQETTDENSPMNIFKDFYTNEEDLMGLYNTAPALKQWVLEGSQKEDFFVSKKLKKFYPGFYETAHGKKDSMEYIYDAILFAKKSGWLEKFGL